jgi:hypothetical protein
MKLVINANDGTITVDTPDDVSAAQFVRELLTGHTPPPTPKAIEAKRVVKKRSRKRKLAPPRADRSLSKAQDEAWAWLAAADRPEGVTPIEMAEMFGITSSAAQQRIQHLIERDMVWKVSRGRYRVGSAADVTVLLNGAR